MSKVLWLKNSITVRTESWRLTARLRPCSLTFIFSELRLLRLLRLLRRLRFAVFLLTPFNFIASFSLDLVRSWLRVLRGFCSFDFFPARRRVGVFEDWLGRNANGDDIFFFSDVINALFGVCPNFNDFLFKFEDFLVLGVLIGSSASSPILEYNFRLLIVGDATASFCFRRISFLGVLRLLILSTSFFALCFFLYIYVFFSISVVGWNKRETEMKLTIPEVDEYDRLF